MGWMGVICAVRQPRFGFAGARVEFILKPGVFHVYRRGSVWKSTGRKALERRSLTIEDVQVSDNLSAKSYSRTLLIDQHICN